MGAWTSISDFISELAEEMEFAHPRLRYAGRETAASPATGLLNNHKCEQAALLNEALRVGVAHVGRIGVRKAKVRKSRTAK